MDTMSIERNVERTLADIEEVLVNRTTQFRPELLRTREILRDVIVMNREIEELWEQIEAARQSGASATCRTLERRLSNKISKLGNYQDEVDRILRLAKVDRFNLGLAL